MGHFECVPSMHQVWHLFSISNSILSMKMKTSCSQCTKNCVCSVGSILRSPNVLIRGPSFFASVRFRCARWVRSLMLDILWQDRFVIAPLFNFCNNATIRRVFTIFIDHWPLDFLGWSTLVGWMCWSASALTTSPSTVIEFARQLCAWNYLKYV